MEDQINTPITAEIRCRALLKRFASPELEPARAAIRTISQNMLKWIPTTAHYACGLDSFMLLYPNIIRSRFQVGILKKPRSSEFVGDGLEPVLNKVYFEEFDVLTNLNYSDEELVRIMADAIVRLIERLKAEEPQLDLIPAAQFDAD